MTASKIENAPHWLKHREMTISTSIAPLLLREPSRLNRERPDRHLSKCYEAKENLIADPLTLYDVWFQLPCELSTEVSTFRSNYDRESEREEEEIGSLNAAVGKGSILN